MAFDPIDTEEIATGEPVKRTTQEKIKENFDNHESRITSIESGTAVAYPPIIMRVNGQYSDEVADEIMFTTMNFNLTITGVRILIGTAGTAGSTEVDILYKRGAGTWTSILSSTLSIPYTDGDYSISSPGTLDAAEVGLLAGDLLRLDLKGAQTDASDFIVRIDFIA